MSGRPSRSPTEGLGLENESPALRAQEARQAAALGGPEAPKRLGAGPVLAMIVAILFWGASFIWTKAAVRDVPPIGFALMRFVLASATLVAASVVTRTRLGVPRELRGRMAWAALLGTTLTYVLENVALKFTTAGNAGLFIAASPLATILGAIAFLGDRLSWRQGLGAALASVAIAHMVGASMAFTGLGDALMALTMIVSVIYSLISKDLADRLPILATLTVSFVLGTLGLLPCAWAEHLLDPQPWHLTPVVWGALAYLGLGASCLACWLWMYALRHMSASTSGAFMYGMPVVTLACSHWFLGEPFGWGKLLEAAVILLGVYLASAEPAVAVEAAA